MGAEAGFPIWASICILIFLVLAALTVDARRYRATLKEAQMRASIEALREHYDALALLDDPQTPSQMIEIALTHSRNLTDDGRAEILERALMAGQLQTPEPEKDETSEFEVVFRDTLRTRPDLVAAFVEAGVSAFVAFIAQRPACAPALNRFLIALARSPASESQKIVRIARGAQGWGGRMMAAEAA